MTMPFGMQETEEERRRRLALEGGSTLELDPRTMQPVPRGRITKDLSSMLFKDAIPGYGETAGQLPTMYSTGKNPTTIERGIARMTMEGTGKDSPYGGEEGLSRDQQQQLGRARFASGMANTAGEMFGRLPADIAPGTGEYLSYKDMREEWDAGHPWKAGLNALGMIPVVGATGRVAKGAIKAGLEVADAAGAAGRVTKKALKIADGVGDAARAAREVETVAKPSAKTARGAKAIALAKSGDEMVDDAVSAIAAEKRGHVGGEMAARSLPPAEALARAKAGMHLKLDNSGQFIGAPQGVGSEEALAAMRAQIDRSIAEGADAADWYDRTRADIERMSGPRPDLQHNMAQNLALHSSQATPETNLGFSLTAHNAMETGHPLEIAKSGPQSAKYNTAREQAKLIDNGPKTGEYENKIDPTSDISNTPVNDIWMGRVFGYKGADGGQWDQGFTQAQHAFMDSEMRLAVDRANAAKVGGRTDWDLAKAQAAPWVYAKGMDLHQKFPNRFPTPQDGFAEANKTYGNYFNKHAANATHEQVPGAGTGHLSGIVDAPREVRERYSTDPRAQWVDGNGRDKLHDAVGFAQDVARPSTGTYTNSLGVLETQPGMVSRPLIGIDNAGKERAIDASSREMLTATEATRGFFDGQEASASHKLFPPKSLGAATSFSIPHTGPLKPHEAQSLSGILGDAGFDMADTGNGVSAINQSVWSDAPKVTSGKQLRGELLAGLGQKIDGVLPGAKGGISQAVSDGTFYSTGLDSMAPGSGGATTRLFETLDQTPFLRDRIGADDAVREKVLGNVDRDIEMAQAMRLPIREDLQNARRIFAQSGFDGLRAALKAGVVALPAAAMILKREHEPAPGQAASPSPRGS